MSDVVRGPQVRSQPPAGSFVWFVFMVGMWVAFFWLLFADRLDDLWKALTQLPILLEVVLWVVFLPWMLGTWVWLSSWPEWLRVALVVCFAFGWIAVSIPRGRKVSQV